MRFLLRALRTHISEFDEICERGKYAILTVHFTVWFAFAPDLAFFFDDRAARECENTCSVSRTLIKLSNKCSTYHVYALLECLRVPLVDFVRGRNFPQIHRLIVSALFRGRLIFQTYEYFVRHVHVMTTCSLVHTENTHQIVIKVRVNIYI